MARENQGLQIALIIFVMLTIILGVTTFLFFRQYEEAANKAAEFEQNATESDNTARKIQDDFNTLKGYCGIAATEPIETSGEQFRAHMDQYAATVPEQNRTYIGALQELFGALQAKNESLVRAESAVAQLQATVQRLEDSKAPLVEQEEQRADNLESQLAQEKTTNKDARLALEQQQKEQYATYLQQQQQAAKAREDYETQVNQQADRIAKLQDLLTERNDIIIKIREPTFVTADGKIRWVNQRNRTVWIDLGRADALQRLTSFSVYPADTNDVTKVGKKASIEVTEILGDHLAEARIVEDEPGNPIMPGDVIFTPVWAPGEREHFALTGLIDLDGDAKSDLQTVIRIITMNGGVVDVYIAEDGQRHGDFTNDTRYLVRGDDPDETAAPEFLSGHKNMINDARERGVMEIKLKDLLDKMGWKNVTPVVRFSRSGTPEQARPQPPEGGAPVSSGPVSPLFQPRQPRPGSRGSAY